MAMFIPYQPSRSAVPTASSSQTSTARGQGRCPTKSRRVRFGSIEIVDLRDDSDGEDCPARQPATASPVRGHYSAAAARASTQNINQAAQGTSGGAEDDESSGSDGDDLPTLQELFSMSQGTISTDRSDCVQRVASPAHQEDTENGILERDRAPGHEDIAAGTASPALIVPANIEAVDGKASSDDCARSPTTELSESLRCIHAKL
ncbi:hypothetical protein P152DRAFT_493427 [Eremomyces bilateralis CBS 781.70]|uniref:Uncharacterized protein n=1 Tax=Eremomyces bilateralis CBS 781.70 TaxID=1392243 RepID=A0A6G1FWA0_9PEZI|nr:uncharacterized protein P152DRAFT_493427 [Eremomyces bilateralis CBS 781.70]KAF1810117.1 hypothetical protein P152DRAFT_493427 [Eremomyces bilateralis CBS 781.70]